MAQVFVYVKLVLFHPDHYPCSVLGRFICTELSPNHTPLCLVILRVPEEFDWCKQADPYHSRQCLLYLMHEHGHQILVKC